MLEYCWLFALLLRSARYFPGAEGKWIPLPPMLPPSSESNTIILHVVYMEKAFSYPENEKIYRNIQFKCIDQCNNIRFNQLHLIFFNFLIQITLFEVFFFNKRKDEKNPIWIFPRIIVTFIR